MATNLFNNINVRTLIQNDQIGKVLHKILTACAICKPIDQKVTTWARLVESTASQEIKEVEKINADFNFKIANHDFRNDEKRKQEFINSQSQKMMAKLNSTIEVPAIEQSLINDNIVLNDAENKMLIPFFLVNSENDTVVEEAPKEGTEKAEQSVPENVEEPQKLTQQVKPEPAYIKLGTGA